MVNIYLQGVKFILLFCCTAGLIREGIVKAKGALNFNPFVDKNVLQKENRRENLSYIIRVCCRKLHNENNSQITHKSIVFPL